jgi:hypothetical protein
MTNFGDPFLYVGHGTSHARTSLTVVLWFEADVAKRSRAALLKSVPAPLCHSVRWGAVRPFLRLASADDFPLVVQRAAAPVPRLDAAGCDRPLCPLKEHPAERRAITGQHILDGLLAALADVRPALSATALGPTGAQWRLFEDRLEDWLRAVHARHPLAFVHKSTQAGPGRSAWSTWHERSLRSEAIDRLLEAPQCGDSEDDAITEWLRRDLARLRAVVTYRASSGASHLASRPVGASTSGSSSPGATTIG